MEILKGRVWVPIVEIKAENAIFLFFLETSVVRKCFIPSNFIFRIFSNIFVI